MMNDNNLCELDGSSQKTRTSLYKEELILPTIDHKLAKTKNVSNTTIRQGCIDNSLCCSRTIYSKYYLNELC